MRRNKSLTDINHDDAENDEINVQDVFQWQAETDEFLQMGDSNTLEDIMFDRGWGRATLNEELRKRRVVLAYLIDRGLNSYAQVAATFQAFINDPETVLALMANEELKRSLEDLREMESVLINVDRDKEEMVPRPEPDEAGREEVERILAEAEELFAEYRGRMPDSVADALLDVAPARDVEAEPGIDREALAQAADEAAALDAATTFDEGADATTPDAGLGAGPATGDGFADGSDAEGGAEASRATAAGGADGASSASGGDDTGGTGDADKDGIDFGEPFDDGIDVLDPDSDPAPDRDPELGPEAAESGAEANVDGGAIDPETGGDAGVAADDDERGDADSGEEADADSGDGSEGDGSEGDDIDDWGFGTVESPEER